MLREIGLKIGVLLCFSSAVMFGASVYSSTVSSDLAGVFGAACKGPCTEDAVKQPVTQVRQVGHRK